MDLEGPVNVGTKWKAHSMDVSGAFVLSLQVDNSGRQFYHGR